ncbi:MAG: transporter substrate-binding domain-containing protein [Parachlamydiaceae bacterium]|nr:transporter substrate-binding domain-containing protein [Parachlamydiaceae bacterium]
MFAGNPPLRVGMELSYPPFEMICPDGSPCGVSVDIANALGKFLDREVIIQNTSFIGLIPSLKNESIDAIISSITITDSRKQAIAFSQPYLKTGLCLLVSAKSDLKDINDANAPNRTIVVKSGTSGEVYALKHLTEAVVHVLDKEAMCVLEVIQGKADAFIYDQMSVFTNWQKNPKTTRAILTPFQIEEWGIGINKNNPTLLNETNKFITEFRNANGFEQLTEKFFLQQRAAFAEQNIKLFL